MSDFKRDEFEIWAVADAISTGKKLRFERVGDWYMGWDHQVMNLGWAAWKASREALVIELPDVSEMAGRAANGNCYSAARLDQHALVIKCIHAAGVKTK